MNIKELGMQDFASLISLVTPRRQEKVLRYFRQDDRLRSLAAGLLLKYELGVTADEEIGYTPYCKPFLVNRPSSLIDSQQSLANRPAEFNLSHGGDYVILATDDRPIGVDIERVEAFDTEVAQRCFTPDELHFLFADEDLHRQQLRFFQLWTGKEAIMKATGLGFHLEPQSFSLTTQTDWQLQWYMLDGHIYCMAHSFA